RPIAKVPSSVSGSLPSAALREVEQAIRSVNINDLETFRRPVPTDQLLRLRQTLAQKCCLQRSLTEVQAMTDRADVPLREARRKSLSVKVAEDIGQDRPGFHSNVAELAEARERAMVLTRNRQSTTFDLTEDRPRPRSAQMKVYQDGVRNVRDLLVDLRGAPRPMRHGVAPLAALDQAEAAGLVRRRL